MRVSIFHVADDASWRIAMVPLFLYISADTRAVMSSLLSKMRA